MGHHLGKVLTTEWFAKVIDHGADWVDGLSDDALQEDYVVGYGKPPLHSRFKKGECPNRRGRPRGGKNVKTIVSKVALEKSNHRAKGKRRRLTNLELVIEAVRIQMARGDPIAVELWKRYSGAALPEPNDVPKGVFIVGEKLTLDEWLERYGHLGAGVTADANADDSPT